MGESDTDLVQRTKNFAVRVLNLVDALPDSRAAKVIAWQLSRSATSVTANYRAARRGRSKKEFIAKLGIVEEEADESLHWLELIVETKLMPEHRVRPLLDEADELVAITVASIKPAKARNS